MQWKSLPILPLLALGILLVPVSHGSLAMAADAPAPTPNLASTVAVNDALAKDVQKFLQLSRTEKAFKAPLDLKVENATVEEIAERMRKALSARKVQSVPRIEVRDVLLTRLSFDRKGSTAGGVLHSTALLAGARVWFFTDYVLIAPEQSLSSEERDARGLGFGSSWAGPGPVVNGANDVLKRKTLSAVVAQELVTPLANVGTATTNGSPNATLMASAPIKTVSVNELSANARSALQELIAGSKDFLQNMHHGHVAGGIDVSVFTLRAESQVGISPNNQGTIVLNFSPTEAMMSWTMNGKGTVIQNVAPKPSSPAVRPALPFDPSAGKS